MRLFVCSQPRAGSTGRGMCTKLVCCSCISVTALQSCTWLLPPRVCAVANSATTVIAEEVLLVRQLQVHWVVAANDDNAIG
jgi:hypothetical protein